MVAARWGADESVEELLRWGANPDAMDANLDTALSLSLMTNSPAISARLAPVTRVGLKKFLQNAAAERVKISEHLHEYIERIGAHQEETLKEALENAVKFGHSDLMKLLSNGELSTMSSTTMNSTDKHRLHDIKIKYRQSMSTKASEMTRQLPKYVEFHYDDKIGKILELLKTDDSATFSCLMDVLHVPEFHLSHDNCPEECKQKDNCSKMRQVYDFVEMAVKEMGKINPVFEELYAFAVGSVIEGTCCFVANEVDLHLNFELFEEGWSSSCHFDVAEQQLVLSDKAPDDFKRHRVMQYMRRGVFNCEDYFNDFIDALAKALKRISTTQTDKFKMKPFTLDFEPCLRCMDVSVDGKTQFKRCRHQIDCLPHHEQGLPECLNGCEDVCNFFSHKKTCNCKEYTNPSMTITKVGAALHLEFLDGSVVDCDLNVPTLPSSTPYDGNVYEVKKYLSKSMPVGWLEEYDRLVDMAGPYASHRTRICYRDVIKMRRIDRDTVLPRQVILNLNQRITCSFHSNRTSSKGEKITNQ